jgi:hypothetical protein
MGVSRKTRALVAAPSSRPSGDTRSHLARQLMTAWSPRSGILSVLMISGAVAVQRISKSHRHRRASEEAGEPNSVLLGAK